MGNTKKKAVTVVGCLWNCYSALKIK